MKKEKEMLNWYKNYYVGAGIQNPAKIQEKLDRNQAVPGIYLITLSDNPGNMLEFFSAVMLKQSAFRRLCPAIVGMAKGKDGAVELLQEMLKDSFRETGTYQVADYLKNR